VPFFAFAPGIRKMIYTTNAVEALLAAIGILIVAAVSSSSAAPRNTPGHLMQQHGSVPGHPGASGYAPGHVKKMRGARSARAFAPGHRRHH
jgi:hypothetical protein